MPISKPLDGLHTTLMRPRVEALLADSAAQARGVWVASAFRSVDRQRQLYAEAEDRCRHNPAKCPPSKWVARPGTSNHGPKVDGMGIAVDFGIVGVSANSLGQWPIADDTWFQALALRHGLQKAMQWEDWHYEPIVPWNGSPPKREGSILMALGLNDDDDRRAKISEWIYLMVGRRPTVKEQAEALDIFRKQGAEACFAAIEKNEEGKKFRKARGW